MLGTWYAADAKPHVSGRGPYNPRIGCASRSAHSRSLSALCSPSARAALARSLTHAGTRVARRASALSSARAARSSATEGSAAAAPALHNARYAENFHSMQASRSCAGKVMLAPARSCALSRPTIACMRERGDAMGSLGTSCGTGKNGVCWCYCVAAKLTSRLLSGRLGAGGELGRWMQPCGVVGLHGSAQPPACTHRAHGAERTMSLGRYSADASRSSHGQPLRALACDATERRAIARRPALRAARGRHAVAGVRAPRMRRR